MAEHHIRVPKTARYFVAGTPGPHIRHVWFACHGYRQLANYFLRKLAPLDDGKTLVVAPEGFHRFYIEGYDGRIGASWMTREDRLSDIADYVEFLDAVYQEVMTTLPTDVRVHALGFSQGTATVTRWLAQGNATAHHLVMYAGMFPPDLNFEVNAERFRNMQVDIAVGLQDEFLKPGMLEKQEGVLKQNEIDFELTRFEGKHDIYADVLMKLATK